ncbi:MFS transporter [Aliiroseovarius sp. YM-037]|uniref:MFS transporter n=1 Tax=Aliiroseovarius sp. YM-037 TaxID=3341728 RepID=UPI003A7FA556
MTGLRSTFQNQPLRRLLLAQLPADFADWLDFVAIGALLAFTWGAEPIVFALLAVCLGLPYVLIGPVAGVLVDRTSIKAVLITSNLGRAVMTASLAFAPSWQVLLPLILLRSSVDAFFTPAKQAAIQALTVPEGRMSANGISHAINQASKIVAPGVGGALLIVIEPGTVFLLNACVSLIAAMLLVGLPAILRDALESNGRESLFGGLKAGWRQVSSNRVLAGALSLMAAGYFAMFFYDTLIAPLTRDLGFDETALGLALAAVGAGGVLGSVWLGLGKESARPFLWIAVGSFISGVAVAFGGAAEAVGANISLGVFIGIFGVVGFSTAMVVVPVRTIIQTECLPERIASVTALSEAANTTALLVAPFIGALIASFSSVGVAFVIGGGLLILIAARAYALSRENG